MQQFWSYHTLVLIQSSEIIIIQFQQVYLKSEIASTLVLDFVHQSASH